MMRRCSITSSFLFVVSPTRSLYPLAFRRGHHPHPKIGCAGRDLNPRPLAYEASELPDCSTAQFFVCLLSKNGGIIAYAARNVNGKNHPDSLWSVGALRCGGINRRRTGYVPVRAGHSEISWSPLPRWPQKMSLSARWSPSSLNGGEFPRLQSMNWSR